MGKHKKNQEVGQYILADRLGTGGNGSVYRATDKNSGKEYALKLLDEAARTSEEKMERFRREVNAMVKFSAEVKGIVPIVDYSLEDFWYAMPLATSMVDYRKKLAEKYKEDNILFVSQCIDDIYDIAKTLTAIHKQGYSHRDVKPENILYYNGRLCLCDFGLVSLPDEWKHITEKKDRIGAKRTIAPEMSRDSRNADGKKADVYSLAKTLWIMLTGNRDCFEGTYDITDPQINLHSYDHLKKVHLVEIHQLLTDATRTNPDNRPTMREFAKRLNHWKMVNGNKRELQISSWNYLNSLIFERGIPTSAIWHEVEDIANVLNTLTILPAHAYMFFPDRGDLDVSHVEKAGEEGCLDVIAPPFRLRVRPRSLSFESFHDNEWDYFLLDLQEQNVVVGDDFNEYEEEVTEDTPGHYVSARYFRYGVYDYDKGDKLPKGAKQITRCLKGKFLIVPKIAPYNQVVEHSDGRHSNCSNDKFRAYVSSLEAANKLKGFQAVEMLAHVCPFKKHYSFKEDEPSRPAGDEQPKQSKNIHTLNFSTYISITHKEKSKHAVYYFEIESQMFNPLSLLDPKATRDYLCTDGSVKNGHLSGLPVLYFDSMIDAIQTYQDISECLNKECDGLYVKVHIQLIKPPSYIFTKSEIEALMRNADDRVNNKLVIDCDGHPQIIQDRNLAIFYPVKHETWCAGNIYVGRYSNLVDLASAYKYCLGKWRDYLKCGHETTMHDYDPYGKEDVESILQEIKGLITTGISSTPNTL